MAGLLERQSGTLIVLDVAAGIRSVQSLGCFER
jgi:hypothetical protein